MSPLERYSQLRDFERTPEPEPEPAAAETGGLRFVVQQHDATRMHFDFRLELDGVLLSWAVPKGPSLDPADKRLAMQTEDHPVSYASFEGLIPKGGYGAGPVIVWDRGTWKPEGGDPGAAVRDGRLTFTLHGHKLSGRWHLIHTGTEGRRSRWLLRKSRDAAAVAGGEPVVRVHPRSVLTGRTVDEVARGVAAPGPADPSGVEGARRAALPERLAPQLVPAVDVPPTGPGWVHELKLDGYRLLARIDEGSVALFSRGGHDVTGRYPAVARTLSALPVRTGWLDGEVVVLDARGRPDFGALQRLEKEPGLRPTLVLFDCVHLDGYDLTGATLSERHRLLEALVPAGLPDVRRVRRLPGDGPVVLHHVCEMGLEGVVSKRADARYEADRRPSSWVKVRCQQRVVLTVVGFTEPSGSRAGLGALVVARSERGVLRYAGKVGAGLSDATLDRLHRSLSRLEREEPPLSLPATLRRRGVHWVEPQLRVRVRFAGWTEEGRLRQPVYEREATGDDTPSPRLLGVALSNPDRVYWPGPAVTKEALAHYYALVGPRMLAEVGNRPLALVRCPEGIGAPCFFQKHVRAGIPDDWARVEVQGDDAPWVAVTAPEHLVVLAQLGVLEVHPVGCRADRPDRPDRVVFDLDPGPDVPWGVVAGTAILLRERLQAMELTPFLRTTGGKGLHLVVPITRHSSWDDVKAFARGLAGWFAARDPGTWTVKPGEANRHGKVFLDTLRNGPQATAVAAWSPRARLGAPVALPLGWDALDPEADGPPPATVRTLLASLPPDPWPADLSVAAVRLTRDRIARAQQGG